MYCSNCGQRLTDDAKHCPNCGILIVRDHAEGGADAGPSGQDSYTGYSYGQDQYQAGYGDQAYRDPYARQSAYPQKTKEDGYALAALILSLVSAVCCCVPVIGLPCAVIGIVFAVKGMKSTERHGMAVAALILSIIFAVCNAVIVVSVAISMAHAATWAEIIEDFDFGADGFDRFYR